MDSTLWTAISYPPSTSKPAIAPVPLTADQAAKLANLIAYYSDAGYRVRGTADGQLTEDEKIFLSSEGIARFLTAVKWDERAAKARLDKCLAWRRSMDVYDLVKTNQEVAPESPAGKEYVIGYTSKSQPILHFLPNRSTTETSDRQFKHAIYMIERTCDLLPPGVQNLLLLIDFSGKRAAPTSPAMAQRFISSLQNHYPERLGKGVLMNIPWIVKQFIDGVSYFMDPVTKQKVATNIEIVKTGVAPKEGATKDYGGLLNFTYEHDVYWPMLLKICLERREEHRVRWLELGGRVGLAEWDFKRGLSSEGKSASEMLSAEKTSNVPEAVNPANTSDAGGLAPPSTGQSDHLGVPRPSTATDRSIGTASFHTADNPPTPPLSTPGGDIVEVNGNAADADRSSPTRSESVSDGRSGAESTATTLHEGHGLSELHISGEEREPVKQTVNTIHELSLAPVALAAPV